MIDVVSLCMWLVANASGELGIEAPVPLVAGGEQVPVCGWPDTVAVLGNGGLCTGTLVHPRVVTFAAHCGGGSKTIHFGERQNGSGRTYQTASCHANPEYRGTTDQAHDWAFCVLAEPVTEIPVTPPLYGCELDRLTDGLPVVIVGFGNSSESGGAGTKRWAETAVVSTFGNTINIGGSGISTCEGDSGGTAYVRIEDGSWRAISMVSTGVGCGLTGVHALMHPAVPWIEATAQIDITPCHDQDGTWNPNATCTGFFAGGAEGYGTWSNDCEGTPRSGPAATCGDPYDVETDTEPPTVRITSPLDRERFERGAQVSIEIEAADEGWGVRAVSIVIDGMEQPVTDEFPPYAFENVQFPSGVFELVARAEDWAGNVAESEAVRIGVNQDVPPEESESSSSGGGESSSTSSALETTSEGGDETEGDPPADGDDGGGSGCGCRSGRPVGAGGGLLLGLVLAAMRRREGSAIR